MKDEDKLIWGWAIWATFCGIMSLATTVFICWMAYLVVQWLTSK